MLKVEQLLLQIIKILLDLKILNNKKLMMQELKHQEHMI
jgi:hypothetical protein